MNYIDPALLREKIKDVVGRSRENFATTNPETVHWPDLEWAVADDVVAFIVKEIYGLDD